MTDSVSHEVAQAELSAAHDERRSVGAEVALHMAGCSECSSFQSDLARLDILLGAKQFDRSPQLSARLTRALSPTRTGWWAVAAISLIGITVGALIGGIATRIERVQADDLDRLFHTASGAVTGLHAELVVVERGWHPEVPERVYTGTLDYVAPESLAIELIDTTSYPGGQWRHNDVRLAVSNGDLTSVATTRCPLPALPGCLIPPRATSIVDLKPFDEGILRPLELVGPGRSLNWWSGLEVLGTPMLEGKATIQVSTTVAAVELIAAVMEFGAWRELHPTDRVLMWLDETTLVPLRIEVLPADSPERSLWQLRRGYSDIVGGDPILIISLMDLNDEPSEIVVEPGTDPAHGGFVDGGVADERPGFEPHRSGHWTLPDGGRVETSSWSDGRSWLMVESTAGWDQPRLFGSSAPFAHRIDLGNGSIGYLSPSGDSVAIHTEEIDVLVSGSVTEDLLIKVATGLGLDGIEVPDDWMEASTVGVGDMPTGTFVPIGEGWSLVGTVDGEVRTILMTGAGSRTILVTQRPGTVLDPPIGADFVAVDIRGNIGRYDLGSSRLEWTEDGWVIRLTSDTVGMNELISIAEDMVSR